MVMWNPRLDNRACWQCSISQRCVVSSSLDVNEGMVISRNEILDKVWGYNHYPTTRTVDNFILTFRKLFENNSKSPNHFLSIRGVGYKFIK